jgi:hypothetical protein
MQQNRACGRFTASMLKLLPLILLISCPVKAQLLNHFRASEASGKVYLSWEIKAGNQCNGIDIERSADGVHFSKIGDIQGVCGSADFAQAYNYTDNTPTPNSFNYYRLILGQQGISDTVVVKIIDVGSKGYVVAPNPADEQSLVYFNAPAGSLSRIIVYNQNGTRVFESADTPGNSISMAGFCGNRGIYPFAIVSDNGSRITGKLFWY